MIEITKSPTADTNTPRQLTDHIVPGAAGDTLTITVTDPPGAGGANHRYTVEGFNTETNPSRLGNPQEWLTILFQNGPIPEHGVNGVTQEALLAIVIDRLRCFQAGPYACWENDDALKSCEHALALLKSRTKSRMARGVEGKHTV